ncbi:Protein of uncharacterised function (DUF3264) [Streptococcus equi subsp. zooepidemicus]|nr:Protein of uncharacterised function (DUF3264) [Streptococcus equi subsp. zooepidemicus]
MGRDVSLTHLCDRSILFQSTRPYGARPTTRQRTWEHYNFNPLARMGRDLSCIPKHLHVFYFNPLARMGRDDESGHLRLKIEISIHSPVWGETLREYHRDNITTISIHSPVWGETVSLKAYSLRLVIFQSTRPYGARQ